MMSGSLNKMMMMFNGGLLGGTRGTNSNGGTGGINIGSMKEEKANRKQELMSDEDDRL